MSRPAKLLSTVVDCTDVARSSRFWQRLLGYDVHHADDDWVTLVDPDDDAVRISFQRSDQVVPATWPRPGVPMQLHLDLLVEDLDAAEALAGELGARALGERVMHENETFRVFADLDGHPFCLIRQGPPA